MRDMTEADLLRAIAEDGDANNARLVLADWLEERGDNPRAEFLRVQCELTRTDLPGEYRHTLRVRERALLDAHRQEWLQAFGLPMEDVRFERGLIAGMRLAKWEQGKLLGAECAPWLLPLAELDLSDLNLGDAGLRAFAEKAHFPALRKLYLNSNQITDTGVKALADAAGLPRLDTVYLFDNRVSDRATATLKKSVRLRLTNVDVGTVEDGYCMSAGQADMNRRRYIRQHLLPYVAEQFQTYPRLQSALLCIAQYWADEANDAVHGSLIVSELSEPTLEGARSYYDAGEEEPDPNIPNTQIPSEYGKAGSALPLWAIHWDDNFEAIPLWACYAPEGGSQEYTSLAEVYAPAVLFSRHGGYDFLPMCRPHLDGIRPEWGEEE